MIIVVPNDSHKDLSIRRLLASRNVAKALAHKVEEGLFGVERARDIARRLFYDNPAQLFGVDTDGSL